METVDEKTKKIIAGFQRNEITEYLVYRSLSGLAKNEHNRQILRKISDEELRHYHVWHKYSGEKVRPDYIKRFFYTIVSMIFGVTFGIKLMERGEDNAQVSYAAVSDAVPEAENIKTQESEHEDQLIRLIDEDKLKYMGSVVLGLNDALVEFTGALAGFTLALQNCRLIGIVGLIMGFSASLSMAASEYLSTKTEDTGRNPWKSSLYTGAAYAVTVFFLVSPYFLVPNYYFALLMTMGLAVLLILLFTFYASVVKGTSFKDRFTEMLLISMGVAALSFLVGLFVRRVLHIEI